MTALNKLNQLLHKSLIWIAGLLLVAMILLTCANIAPRVIRALFRALFALTHAGIFDRMATGFPAGVPGTFELMGFLGAVVAAFALANTQNKRGHIAVDVLVNTFPVGVRKMLRGLNSLLCLGFFGIATWQIAKKATILQKTGEVSETLRIIYYPFTYAVAAGCAVLCLTFVIEFLNNLFGSTGAVMPRRHEDTK
jgi:TRAP-type C4-dicarboxylate transport system permease small subunit